MIAKPFQHSVPITPGDSPRLLQILQRDCSLHQSRRSSASPSTFRCLDHDAAGFTSCYGLLNCSSPNQRVYDPVSKHQFSLVLWRLTSRPSGSYLVRTRLPLSNYLLLLATSPTGFTIFLLARSTYQVKLSGHSRVFNCVEGEPPYRF